MPRRLPSGNAPDAIPGIRRMGEAETLPIVVVVLAYNETERIGKVLARMSAEVAQVIVVVDGSTDGTAETVGRLDNPRLILIRHDGNQGMGGAVCSGYRRALETGAGIVVKVDGDELNDPAGIPRLVSPWAAGRGVTPRAFGSTATGITGGCRSRGSSAISASPSLRKMVSGYWNTLDPANGFTAPRWRALERPPSTSWTAGSSSRPICSSTCTTNRRL